MSRHAKCFRPIRYTRLWCEPLEDRRLLSGDSLYGILSMPVPALTAPLIQSGLPSVVRAVPISVTVTVSSVVADTVVPPVTVQSHDESVDLENGAHGDSAGLMRGRVKLDAQIPLPTAIGVYVSADEILSLARGEQDSPANTGATTRFQIQGATAAVTGGGGIGLGDRGETSASSRVREQGSDLPGPVSVSVGASGPDTSPGSLASSTTSQGVNINPTPAQPETPAFSPIALSAGVRPNVSQPGGEKESASSLPVPVAGDFAPTVADSTAHDGASQATAAFFSNAAMPLLSATGPLNALSVSQPLWGAAFAVLSDFVPGGLPILSGADPVDGGQVQTPPVGEGNAAEPVVPAAADLLASCNPYEVQSLEAAFGQLLDHLEGLGQGGSSLSTYLHAGPWFLAAATLAVACELHRRRLEQARDRLLLTNGLTWFPNLDGTAHPFNS